jgi:hypothetical protein
MPTRRNRRQNKTKKGGFSNSDKIWDFGISKVLVDKIGTAPKGTKKSLRKCLDYFASLLGVSTEDLYNKITPDEMLVQLSRQNILGKTVYGTYAEPWEKYRDLWQHDTAQKRDAALAAGKTWGSDEALMLKALPA